MAKKLENTYRLDNANEHIKPADMRRAVNEFEFFMSNYQQIVNKERQLVPFKLNEFQRRLFETILPMVKKETRLDRRHRVVVVKGRQVGASVGVVALINNICAFVSGMEHLNVGHVFPVGDTITKFYKQKVEPIITGVHPDLFPTMTRETLSSSILTHYKDIKGIPRDNYYELISSGASSIRSSTVNVLLEDEVAFYTHPEQLEDAILPAVPDYGFSLIVYLSTVSDKKTTFFLDKIKTARDNPEDWSLVFVPWYFTYPERPVGIDFDSLILSEYEANVMVPAFERDHLPRERWGDCIDWYRRRAQDGTSMKMEYPTTLEEVLTMGEDEKVFGTETLQKQEKNIEDAPYYRLITDNLTEKVEAQQVEDETPLKIYRSPVYGRRYRLTVDPITAQSDQTDFFSMSMWDTQSHEQMAVFHGRGFSDDDYADQAVCMAKIYNNAEICPEINVASGFIAGVNNRHYYRWFYANDKARKNKEIGLRTTASSKERMIDQLKTLLDREIIIIHDRDTLDELNNFVKKVRLRGDGTKSVYMAAKGKTHDDLCFTAILFAGSLNQRDLQQRKKVSFSLAW